MEPEILKKKEHTTLRITLPDDVVEHLAIKKEEEAILTIKDMDLIIKLKNKSKKNQSISLQWFLIPSLLISAVFFIYFYYQDQKYIPLTGTNKISIASMVIMLGLVSGILSFLFFFIQGKKGNIIATTKDIYWRNFPTILVSFAIVIVSSSLFFFWVLELLFEGISFDIYTSTIFFFTLVNIINYIMIYIAISLTPTLLTNILIMTIIAGVGVAMITNGEQQWWQHNFSFLGTPEASRAWSFNITLIFSALLLIALIDYLFVILQKVYPKTIRITILRVLLTLVALNFGGVGLFPYNHLKLFQTIHNRVAQMLVFLIIILIVTLRWLLPEIAKEFLRLSYLIGFGLIIATVLWQGVGYFSLTAFELIAFMLAFTWLFLLIHKLREMAESVDKVYHITIE